MDADLDKDPEIAELKRADAARRRKRLIIAAAVVALPVAYWAYGFVSLRAALEADGLTDVKVSASGPFEYKFEGKQGDSKCSGAITRLPFSPSRNSFCYSIGPSGATGSSETKRQ